MFKGSVFSKHLVVSINWILSYHFPQLTWRITAVKVTDEALYVL